MHITFEKGQMVWGSTSLLKLCHEIIVALTQDYWVSVLHKALVGKVVLDVKQSHNNNTHIHVYCHCTNHHTAGLFGDRVSYKHGAVTCFGINHLSTKKVKITLKLGSRGKWNEKLHQYLLTPAGEGWKSR
jgi:hypothetical protein